MATQFWGPRTIPSAVTDAEAMKLAELAQGQKVLELGAHYGFSTIILAQSAAELHSVDWHKGDSQAGHGDNLIVYRQNLALYGCEDKVVSHVGRFEDVLPAFRSGYFDGCFLDGEHDRASVKRDLEGLLRVVKKGGWIAFHDYGRFDVAQIVDAFAPVEVFDWLAVAVKP